MRVFSVASGVRTASMQPKDSMGTREIRQAQAWLVGSDKLKKRGRSEGLMEVRLPDSTSSRESRLHGEAGSRS